MPKVLFMIPLMVFMAVTMYDRRGGLYCSGGIERTAVPAKI